MTLGEFIQLNRSHYLDTVEVWKDGVLVIEPTLMIDVDPKWHKYKIKSFSVNPFYHKVSLHGDDYRIEILEIEYECGKSSDRPKGKWIPVSERLPKEEDYRDCYGLPDGCILWQTDNGDIGFGWYYHSTECWSDLNDNLIKAGKVIAWQPLPEPYKEADNEQ